MLHVIFMDFRVLRLQLFSLLHVVQERYEPVCTSRGEKMTMRRNCFALLLTLLSAGLFAAQPARFNYQGKLADASGAPLSGTHTFFFDITHGGNSDTVLGEILYSETATLAADRGVVSHTIGTGTPTSGSLTAAMFKANGDFHVRVAVDSALNVISPRTRLEPVPFALTSGDGGELGTPIDSLPFNITQPGYYYLTGDLTGTAGQDGIVISASPVHLDLRGFRLQGVPSSQTGIEYSGGDLFEGSLTIVNGTVEDWGFYGMFVANIAGVFRNLNVVSNGIVGMEVGNGSLVENCSIRKNAGYGIRLSNQSTIRNCLVSENLPQAPNGAFGIEAGNGCLIENNNVSRNGGNEGPVHGGGIYAEDGCIIRNNNCFENTSGDTNQAVGYGIRAGNGCHILNNNCSGNGALHGGGATITIYGIYALQRCLVKENVCSNNTAFGLGNAIGIEVGTGSRVEANTSTNHAGSNGSGIQTAGSRVVIVRNSTSGNQRGLTLTIASSNVYYAENTFSDSTANSLLGGSHTVGTGDRSNIAH